jgi:hypothetical protein
MSAQPAQLPLDTALTCSSTAQHRPHTALSHVETRFICCCNQPLDSLHTPTPTAAGHLGPALRKLIGNSSTAHLLGLDQLHIKHQGGIRGDHATSTAGTICRAQHSSACACHLEPAWALTAQVWGNDQCALAPLLHGLRSTGPMSWG